MPGAIGFVATYPRPFPGIHALSAENRSPRRHKSKAVSLDCDVSKRGTVAQRSATRCSSLAADRPDVVGVVEPVCGVQGWRMAQVLV